MTMSDSRAPNSNTYPSGGYQGGIPAAPYAPGQATPQGANPYQAAGPYWGYPQSYTVGPQVQMPPAGQLGVHCLRGGGVGAAPDNLSGALAADQHGIWEDPSLSLTFRRLYSADDNFGHGSPQHDWPDHRYHEALGSVEEVAVELVGDRPQRESIYLFRNLFYPLGDGRQHALDIRARSSE